MPALIALLPVDFPGPRTTATARVPGKPAPGSLEQTSWMTAVGCQPALLQCSEVPRNWR